MTEQNVTGLKELQQFLDALPAKMEANILRGALRAGAKVQLTRAKELVPVESDGPHPGALRDSLRIGKTSIKNGVMKIPVVAGSRKKPKPGSKAEAKAVGRVDAYWARWVEFGTAAHFIKPKNRKSLFFAGLAREVINHPGAKPKPFMRPALDATLQAAVAAVGEYIRKRLTKEGIDVPGPENT